MSYDIHGNPLKVGHCEVHPDVAQTYPCSLCIIEKDQQRMLMRQERDEHDRAELIADLTNQMWKTSDDKLAIIKAILDL